MKDAIGAVGDDQDALVICILQHTPDIMLLRGSARGEPPSDAIYTELGGGKSASETKL